MIWLFLLSMLVMLLSALGVLFFKNYIAAIAASSVVSLVLSILFVLLKAPDVALTEAAVGAGLSGVIFALTLKRVGLWKAKLESGQ